MRRSLLLALVVALALAPGAVAHDGHGSIVVMGTVKKVTAKAVEVEAIDPNSTNVRLVQLKTDASTKYKLGKEKVEPSALVAGARVVVSTEYKTGPDGVITYQAVEFRISSPKAARK